MNRLHYPLACLALILTTATTGFAAATEQGHPLFDRIDTNHDGFIELSEWIAARHEFLTKLRAEGGGAGQGGPGSTMHALNHPQSAGSTGPSGSTTTDNAGVTQAHPRMQEDENHHPLFDRIDTNHDGKISLAEWIAFRREHHHEHPRPATPPAGAGTPPVTPTTGSATVPGATTTASSL